jgi:hypothetical protein
MVCGVCVYEKQKHYKDTTANFITLALSASVITRRKVKIIMKINQEYYVNPNWIISGLINQDV